MTTLVRWDPLREAAAMHTELSRMMNGLFEGNGRQTQAWVPTLDVWETEDAIRAALAVCEVGRTRHGVTPCRSLPPRLL